MSADATEDALPTASEASMNKKVGCTCRYGREHDGSEFGLCEFCERASDAAAMQKAVTRDAARWRISQIIYARRMDNSEGFFATCGDSGRLNEDSWHVGIQPHPVTNATGINHCIMGRGKTKAEAIDGMFATLTACVEEGAALPIEIESARSLFEIAMTEDALACSSAPLHAGSIAPSSSLTERDAVIDAAIEKARETILDESAATYPAGLADHVEEAILSLRSLPGTK